MLKETKHQLSKGSLTFEFGFWSITEKQFEKYENTMHKFACTNKCR